MPDSSCGCVVHAMFRKQFTEKKKKMENKGRCKSNHFHVNQLKRAIFGLQIQETNFNLLGKNSPIKCGLGWTIYSLIKMWIHKSVGLNEDVSPSNCQLTNITQSRLSLNKYYQRQHLIPKIAFTMIVKIQCHIVSLGFCFKDFYMFN